MRSVILLAAYNGERHLPALTESIRQQTDSDFSVLMQDDGSTDQTVPMLEKLSPWAANPADIWEPREIFFP